MSPNFEAITHADGTQQVWGTADALTTNRQGRMTELQLRQVKNAAIGLPIMGLLLALGLWIGLYFAFKDEPRGTAIILVLGLVVLFPVGVMMWFGRKSWATFKEGACVQAFGPVNLVKTGGKVNVHIGEAVVPLLAAWAAVFTQGHHYEIYYNPGNKNILSGAYLGPPQS